MLASVALRSRLGGWVVLAALVPMLAGCDVDALDPPSPPVVWEGHLFLLEPDEPEPGVYFTGVAGIIAAQGQTEIGIALTEAEPGMVFGWVIRSGSCEAPGGAITTAPGAFPDLVVDELGEALVNVVLGGELQGSHGFVAWVHLADDPAEAPVACGDLVRRD